MALEIASADEHFAAIKAFVRRVALSVQADVLVQIRRIAEGTKANLAFQWFVTLSGNTKKEVERARRESD